MVLSQLNLVMADMEEEILEDLQRMEEDIPSQEELNQVDTLLDKGLVLRLMQTKEVAEEDIMEDIVPLVLQIVIFVEEAGFWIYKYFKTHFCFHNCWKYFVYFSNRRSRNWSQWQWLCANYCYRNKK